MMVERLTNGIINAEDKEPGTGGKARYKVAFVDTKIYKRYRAEVDQALILEGYGHCIITAEEEAIL